MQTYRITSSVSGTVPLAGFGVVDFEYEAGTITASDAKDDAVLAHLVSIGLATTAEPIKAKAPKVAVSETASAKVEE